LGELDTKRLQRWRKLIAEEFYNTQTLAERRSKNRSFSKMVKRATKDKGRFNKS
jgi:ribosome biogenesis GTPase